MPGPNPLPTFEIRESQSGESVRLTLVGELDLASSPLLEDRLAHLRATRSPVRLDLSQLAFIDSTGIRLLIRTIGDSRMKRWEVLIEPEVAPEVMRLFRLVRWDPFVVEDPAEP